MSASAGDPNRKDPERNQPGPRPIRCLIIQMTRLGDTLQSLMALRAAKQLYPHLEIHFLARERFAAAARKTPWLESVIALPAEKILSPAILAKGGREAGQGQSLREAARWLAPLVQEPWDLVVNWSYSESSSYLTGLVPGRIKLGYSRTIRKPQPGAPTSAPTGANDGLSCLDGWSHYIQAIVQGGIHQNIHLTDVLTTQLLTALQIHFGDPADNGDAPVTSKSFFTLAPDRALEQELGSRWRDRSRKWVALQLGAANPAKTWDLAHWTRLAGLILSRNPEFGLILLGGKEDREKADQLVASLSLGKTASNATSSLISLVGRSDFDSWASVVSRCSWVFTGDTAAVHLASVLGTRVFNVSVGPVRFAETGPYGNGHFVVTTNQSCPACAESVRDGEHLCRRNLSAEAVYGAWSFALQSASSREAVTPAEHMRKIGLGHEVENIRIHRSRIRASSDGGGVAYDCVSGQPLRLPDWTAMVMGHIARAWYCGWVPAVGMELSRGVISPELIKRLREIEESSQLLSKICDEATRTAAILNRRGSTLRSDKVMRIRDREEIAELGARLTELDSLMERMGRTHAPLQAFSQMSKVLMHNLRGTQLAELGRESAEAYQQLGEGINILREWVRFTLGLARPVAIRTEPLALVERT